MVYGGVGLEAVTSTHRGTAALSSLLVSGCQPTARSLEKERVNRRRFINIDDNIDMIVIIDSVGLDNTNNTCLIRIHTLWSRRTLAVQQRC